MHVPNKVENALVKTTIMVECRTDPNCPQTFHKVIWVPVQVANFAVVTFQIIPNYEFFMVVFEISLVEKLKTFCF